MPTLSDLISAIADIVDVDRVRVARLARFAREGGAVSTGGRGRGGAVMTTRDAASLLGLLLAGAPAQRAGITLATLERLNAPPRRYADGLDNNPDGVGRIVDILPVLARDDHSIVDAIACALDLAIATPTLFVPENGEILGSTIDFNCRDYVATIDIELTGNPRNPQTPDTMWIEYSDRYAGGRPMSTYDDGRRLLCHQYLGFAAIGEIGAFLAAK